MRLALIGVLFGGLLTAAPATVRLAGAAIVYPTGDALCARTAQSLAAWIAEQGGRRPAVSGDREFRDAGPKQALILLDGTPERRLAVRWRVQAPVPGARDEAYRLSAGLAGGTVRGPGGRTRQPRRPPRRLPAHARDGRARRRRPGPAPGRGLRTLPGHPVHRPVQYLADARGRHAAVQHRSLAIGKNRPLPRHAGRVRLQCHRDARPLQRPLHPAVLRSDARRVVRQSAPHGGPRAPERAEGVPARLGQRGHERPRGLPARRPDIAGPAGHSHLLHQRCARKGAVGAGRSGLLLPPVRGPHRSFHRALVGRRRLPPQRMRHPDRDEPPHGNPSRVQEGGPGVRIHIQPLVPAPVQASGPRLRQQQRLGRLRGPRQA